MDFKILRKTERLVEEGVWITWCDADPDAPESPQFLIRANTYKPFQREVSERTSKLAAWLKADPTRSVTLLNKLLAKHIWIDSKNLELDGVPVNTEERRLAMLEDIPDVQRFITDEYSRSENYQQEAQADDAAAVKSVDAVAGGIGSSGGKVPKGA